jgi:hypothetical protein
MKKAKLHHHMTKMEYRLCFIAIVSTSIFFGNIEILNQYLRFVLLGLSVVLNILALIRSLKHYHKTLDSAFMVVLFFSVLVVMVCSHSKIKTWIKTGKPNTELRIE